MPYLSKQHGCVLNIGSVNAYSGEPNLFAYSVSKGALMTLTRNLGDTLHRENGVRVNQINPGWVLTETEKKRKKSFYPQIGLVLMMDFHSQKLSQDYFHSIAHMAPVRNAMAWVN